MEFFDDLEDLFHQNGGKSHGGLVKHHELRTGHERTAHCEHLLLSAGERAGDLAAALLEAGELPEYLLKVFLRQLFADECAHFEILHDGHLQENAPTLGNVGHAAQGKLVAVGVGDVIAEEGDAPVFRMHHAGDGLERRGFAGAVCTDESDDLALVHVEGSALQGVDVAVIDVDVFNIEHAGHITSPPSCRGTPQ